MPLFTWFETYSIRNREIDSQHKELFALLNRLYDSSYDAGDNDAIYGILDELIAYSGYHFQTEEQYMAEIGYEGLDKQRIEHDYFTEKIRSLKRSDDLSVSELTRDTIVFLGRWLLHHVTVEDKKISP